MLTSLHLLCHGQTPAPASPSSRAAEKPDATIPSYRLSAQDLVHIRVFQEDDLESRARISRDGSILFPLVGTVRIGGQTVEEAARLIRQLLQKDFLVDPQVSITVEEYSRRRFTVLGQAQNPGTYLIPAEEQVDLLQAIAMAGGYTRIADPGRITVKRRRGGVETVLQFNAREMARKQGTPTIEIQADDTITISESIF